MSEDEAYDRAGVDQLPEKCYREVHKSCLQPDGDKLISCMFKEKCCKKLIIGHIKATEATEIARIMLKGWQLQEIYHAV